MDALKLMAESCMKKDLPVVNVVTLFVSALRSRKATERESRPLRVLGNR